MSDEKKKAKEVVQPPIIFTHEWTGITYRVEPEDIYYGAESISLETLVDHTKSPKISRDATQLIAEYLGIFYMNHIANYIPFYIEPKQVEVVLSANNNRSRPVHVPRYMNNAFWCGETVTISKKDLNHNLSVAWDLRTGRYSVSLTTFPLINAHHYGALKPVRDWLTSLGWLPCMYRHHIEARAYNGYQEPATLPALRLRMPKALAFRSIMEGINYLDLNNAVEEKFERERKKNIPVKPQRLIDKLKTCRVGRTNNRAAVFKTQSIENEWTLRGY